MHFFARSSLLCQSVYHFFVRCYRDSHEATDMPAVIMEVTWRICAPISWKYDCLILSWAPLLSQLHAISAGSTSAIDGVESRMMAAPDSAMKEFLRGRLLPGTSFRLPSLASDCPSSAFWCLVCDVTVSEWCTVTRLYANQVGSCTLWFVMVTVGGWRLLSTGCTVV